MGFHKVKISTWANNQDLKQYLENEEFNDVSFEDYSKNTSNPYLCLFVDLSKNLDQITSNLINICLAAKEKKQKTIIVLISDLEGNHELLAQYKKLYSELKRSSPSLILVICQDLYTLAQDKSITQLDQYLQSILLNKENKVSHDGKRAFYPLPLFFVVNILKKIFFLSSTGGENFYLQGDVISDLNLAYLLKSNSLEYLRSDIDINNTLYTSSAKNNYTNENISTLTKLNIVENMSFEKDIKDYFKIKKNSIGQNEENFLITKSTKSKFKIKTLWHREVINKVDEERPLREIVVGSIKRAVENILGVIALSYLVISIIFIASSIGTLKNIEKSVFNLKKGEISLSTKYLKQAEVYGRVSKSNYIFISPVIRFFYNKIDIYSKNYLSFVDYSLSVLTSLSQTYNLTEKVYMTLNSGDQKTDYSSLALGLKSNLQQSYESLNQLEIILNKNELPKPLLQKIKQNVEYEQLKSTQKQMSELIKVVDLLPILVGDKKGSNLFILVQNNHEQRATGGIIDYVHQITLDKGKIIYQKTFQPQEIDKIDSFTLLPPPLIEKLTGDSVWKLRDMNYNPDYPQTATNIAWYLEKKLKITPDAIISMNTSVFENQLKKNKDFSRQLTAINYEGYKAKLRAGEGLLETKLLLENLLDVIVNKKENLTTMGEIFLEAFTGRSVNIWVSDQTTEKSILTQNYSGSIREYECHLAMSSARKCLSQSVHLNFSNFSQIPLNDYLIKKTTHTITPSVISIVNQITVSYEYQKSTPLINRNLTEIAQLYLPKTAVIDNIKLDNVEIPASELAAQEEATLSRYQFLVSTELNKSHTLQINYTIPLQEKTILPIAFSVASIKQSGDSNSESTIEINIPEQSRASAVTSEVQSTPDKIIYKEPNTTSVFGINFVPKFL